MQDFLQSFEATKSYTSPKQLKNVMDILNEVQESKDEALIEYTEKFDGKKIDKIKIPENYLKESYEQLDPNTKAALKVAKDRVTDYEQKIKYTNKDLGEFKYVYRPLEKIGVYVPGGTALYPSSVLMSVVPAQVAGVKEIHVTTPTFERNNITFATLYLLGIKNVYTIGGAQAIAALAYGTETIPKVDKIVGPGNSYVALAKRLVFGDVGIDSIAGPSEILLYVDDSTDVDQIVYDIFAQSEHDEHARTFLLTESQELTDRIKIRIQEKIDGQPRSEIIRESIKNNHYPIVDSRENLLKALNYIAPEHVSIQHRDQDEIVERINYSGAVFKGKYSPEAIGDYIAGPSHVLPTNRTGRFSHGLNVNDFQTSHAVIELADDTYQEIAPYAEIIAEKEGLFAHKDSLTARKIRNKEE